MRLPYRTQAVSVILPAVIIASAVILSLTSLWNDSLTYDEVAHIGAGYSYVIKGDMRLNPEHPPLVKDISGLGVAFLTPLENAFQSNAWTKDVNGQWDFGKEFIYKSGNNADNIMRAARIPLLIFFILAAILVFRWTRRMWGDGAGITALILFAFSPTVLAHGRLVTTDSAAMFGVVIATYYFLQYLRERRRKTFLLAAGALGLALVTKFSTILLIPFLLIVAALYGLTESGMKMRKNIREAIHYMLRACVVFAVGFVLVVWPLYILNTINYPAQRQQADTAFLLRETRNRIAADIITAASGTPVIRSAAHYFLGIAMVFMRSSGGHTTYFLGEVDNNGWWYYFPVVYFIKEPLAWWLLVFIALIGAVFTFNVYRARWNKLSALVRNDFESVAMLLWIVIYWVASLDSNLNIGVRHLLPTYPFAIMLVAGQIGMMAERFRTFDRERLKAFAFLIAFSVGWYAYESVRIHPYYLTYFNQVVGGPAKGHSYTTDSNLDWGQDLKRLTQWIEKQKIERIELDYFGQAEPEYYLGQKYLRVSSNTYRDAEDFIRRNRSAGWIAVSATYLESSIGDKDDPARVNYTWLKSYKPVTVVGNSIFVWQITR